MTTLIAGKLVDGAGNQLPNIQIQVKTISNASSLVGAVAYFYTDNTGNYSFPLLNGSYSVFVHFGMQGPHFVGSISITTESPETASLDQILVTPPSVEPIVLTQVLQALIDAEKAATDAQASQAIAQSAAASAQAVSDGGTTFATTAAGIAATTSGQYFRVPQGTGSDASFIYYLNNSGVALAVAEQVGLAAITNNIQQNQSLSDMVIFTDELGFSHSRIHADGTLETPMLKLAQDEITSGNISILEDSNFEDDKLMISDGLGFSVPATSVSTGGGGVDPGEVTVDLPPQSAAYGLLSKMRSGLDDVCVIINSDSTGVTQDTDPVSGVFKKWTRKLAEFLAGNYPAYTVLYYSWASGAYGSPVTLQVGTAGKTLHFYNAAVAGTQPLYLMGQYFEAAYVPRQADLLIFNHGHNTDYTVVSGIQAGMTLAAVYQILLRHPTAGAIVVSQNPLRDNAQGNARSAGSRQAAISAGFSLVDAYQLFMNAGKPADWYLDNVHPNDTGDSKIFDLVKNLFVWPSTPSKYTQGLINGLNLISNSEFATWEDTDASPTGWALTGCTAEKDTTNFESGGYGLKLTSTGTGDANASFTIPTSLIKRLRGQTITVACRVYVPTTNTRSSAGSFLISGMSGSRTYGVPSPNGRGGFVWKAAVLTVPLTASALSVVAVLDTSGGAAGNSCTFDRLTLVVGNIPQDFF